MTWTPGKSETKTDASGRGAAAPGCVASLKYLELAPDGPHANDVRHICSF
jgi:hypothetical protein